MSEPRNWIQLDSPSRYVEIDVQGGVELDQLTVEAWVRVVDRGGGPVLDLRRGTDRVRFLVSWYGESRLGYANPHVEQSWNASRGWRPRNWCHVSWSLRKVSSDERGLEVFLSGERFFGEQKVVFFPAGTFDRISIGTPDMLGRFAGDLAHVRMWSRPLSQGEIQRNLQQDREYQPIANKAGLIGWWKMDDLSDDSPPKVPDSSGNGHHGTVHETAGRRVGSRGQARSRPLRGRPQ